MPRVSEFFGVLIYLYPGDDNRHHAPHFHAYYAEHAAVFGIPGAEILAGSMPRRQVRFVQAWAYARQDELEQAWSRAVNGEPPGVIDPIR